MKNKSESLITRAYLFALEDWPYLIAGVFLLIVVIAFAVAMNRRG